LIFGVGACAKAYTCFPVLRDLISPLSTRSLERRSSPLPAKKRLPSIRAVSPFSTHTQDAPSRFSQLQLSSVQSLSSFRSPRSSASGNDTGFSIRIFITVP
jgi:hypothetical protein